MQNVIYATGNAAKFRQAQNVCNTAGIELVQERLDVPELQSDNGETIALDKAAKAFANFNRPVIISDDNWSIPGLNGFPGPYMKYVNDWFSPEDWLNLTHPLKDRRIILTQTVVYQDATGPQLFSCALEGIILTEGRGKSNFAHASITSFDGGKHSNAEFHERDESSIAHLPNVWHKFVEWYRERPTQA